MHSCPDLSTAPLSSRPPLSSSARSFLERSLARSSFTHEPPEPASAQEEKGSTAAVAVAGGIGPWG